MCLLSDELTATAAVYPWRHTAVRLMGGGLVGASSWEPLPWHPRLPQLVPHTWQTQACQPMGTIRPHSSAVPVLNQNGAVGTLSGWSQHCCFWHGVPKGAGDGGREGLYTAVGRYMLGVLPRLRIWVEATQERRWGKGSMRGWKVWWSNLNWRVFTAGTAHPFVMVTPVTSAIPYADAVFNFFLIQHWPFPFPLSMASAAALSYFTCTFHREILCPWQCPFPQALLHLQLQSHSCGHWGGHLLAQEPSKGQGELPGLYPVAWCLPFTSSCSGMWGWGWRQTSWWWGHMSHRQLFPASLYGVDKFCVT